MIMSDGLSPNSEGGIGLRDGTSLTIQDDIERHRQIILALKEADPDCKICFQIPHMGSIAKQESLLATSPVQSCIN